MFLGFIPVAEASVSTLMKSINRVIINPIIFLLFALALVFFLYGVFQYLSNPDNEDIRKTSRSHMLYGVIGLFVMVAVFGIMQLILNTVGEKRIQIHDTGDYEIVDTGASVDDEFFKATNDSTSLDMTAGEMQNLSTSQSFTNFSEEKDYKDNPFKAEYVENNNCWHEYFYQTATTEYRAIQLVKTASLQSYAAAVGKNVDELVNLPLNFGILTSYDESINGYYAWMDARGPINGGNNNDCVLKVTNTEELYLKDFVNSNPFTQLKDVSKGTSILTGGYQSDAFYYRAISSGVSPILSIARDIAIKNAFVLLGIEMNVSVNDFTTFRIVEEKWQVNNQTGDYEYWVAVESERR